MADVRSLPSKSAISAVMVGLLDEDVEVRLEAASIAAEMRLESAIPLVGRWLTSAQVPLRLAALRVLERVSAPQMVPAIARSLADGDATVRAAGCRALAAGAAAEGLSALIGRLDDTELEVRRAAVRALGVVGTKSAVVPLIGVLRSDDAVLRAAAALALGTIGDREAVGALMLLTTDGESAVRVAAIRGIRRLGAQAAQGILVDLLAADAIGAVRVAAADALATIGGRSAVDPIVERLGSVRLSVWERERLVLALRVAGLAARESLENCVASVLEGPRVMLCASALLEVAPHGAHEVIVRAATAGRLVQRDALSLLSELGDDAALPYVLASAEAIDPTTRRAALRAAVSLLEPSLHDGRAVAPLRRVLRSVGSREELILVLRALGNTGDPKVAGDILPYLVMEAPAAVRIAAAESLGHLHSSESERALIHALADIEPDVRLAAALSLRRGIGRPSVASLLELYTSARPVDRDLVAFALGGRRFGGNGNNSAAQILEVLSIERGGRRDSLLEALMSSDSERAASWAEEWLARADSGDRAKIAELSEWIPTSRSVLRRLAEDVSANVRQNAVWALGAQGNAEDLPLLDTIWRHGGGGLAGNAVASIARIGVRYNLDVSRGLCQAAGSPIPVVRVNALVGLARARDVCPRRVEEHALLLDPSAEARRAAARLMHRRLSAATSNWRVAALLQCLESEPNGAVAAACLGATEPERPKQEELVIYVVPVGREQPVPEAPFALELPSGFIRLGAADRRGALLQRVQQRGSLRLRPPGELTWPASASPGR